MNAPVRHIRSAAGERAFKAGIMSDTGLYQEALRRVPDFREQVIEQTGREVPDSEIALTLLVRAVAWTIVNNAPTLADINAALGQVSSHVVAHASGLLNASTAGGQN